MTKFLFTALTVLSIALGGGAFAAPTSNASGQAILYYDHPLIAGEGQ